MLTVLVAEQYFYMHDFVFVKQAVGGSSEAYSAWFWIVDFVLM